jgi:hypothetical protein
MLLATRGRWQPVEMPKKQSCQTPNLHSTLSKRIGATSTATGRQSVVEDDVRELSVGLV